MAIAWRDGVSNAGTVGASLAVTLPAGIQAGDVVLIMATFQAQATSVNPALSIGSTATTPVLLTSPVLTSDFVTSELWWLVASGGDAGATVTVTADRSCFAGMSAGAWSGASSSQPDVISAGTPQAGVSTWPASTAVTVAANDWLVALAGANGGAPITASPAGTTSRETDSFNQSSIADSNGSVGGGGTTIGGGNWTSGFGASWRGWTVGLAEAVSGVTVSGVTAAVALDAPAGSITFPGSVAGALAALALAAPAGTLQSAGAATVSGPVAQLVLAAPAGSPFVPAAGGAGAGAQGDSDRPGLLRKPFLW